MPTLLPLAGFRGEISRSVGGGEMNSTELKDIVGLMNQMVEVSKHIASLEAELARVKNENDWLRKTLEARK